MWRRQLGRRGFQRISNVEVSFGGWVGLEGGEWNGVVGSIRADVFFSFFFSHTIIVLYNNHFGA